MTMIRDRKRRAHRALAPSAMLLALAVAACGTSEATEAPTIQSTPVTRGDMQISVEATGQVEPIRKVEVKSKASGEILRLHVDVGDEVEQGSLLAAVDPRDVQNGYDQAQADLEVARARVEIARSQLERSSQLLASEVITQQEHEGRVLESANAQSALVRAETNLELARLRLTDVTIRAPLAGTVLQREVEEGQVIQSASGNVSGGTTLMVMAALDQVQVRTLVDETDVGQLRAGLGAAVRVEAYPDRMFAGRVEKIEPQAVVQQNVVMFPVIVTLDNSERLLKPGMNAEVEVVVTQRPQTLQVPNNAVVNMGEVAAAAGVLGLDPETTSVDRAAFGALQQELAGARGAGAAGTEVEAGAAAAAPTGESAAADDPRARMAELRAQVERGEITPDSLRSLMRARAGAGAGGAGGGAAGGMRVFTFGGAPGGGGPGAAGRPGAPRPAVVFVVGEDGVLTPRPILMGVNDWDNTEVLAGLQEGEAVALIGAAQLQAQQREFVNRIQSMRGGGGGGMVIMRGGG